MSEKCSGFQTIPPTPHICNLDNSTEKINTTFLIMFYLFWHAPLPLLCANVRIGWSIMPLPKKGKVSSNHLTEGSSIKYVCANFQDFYLLPTTCTTVRLVRVTRVKKILQRSRYRGIVNYYFTYHFGRKLKIYLASLLRYGYPVCDIDWFNVPNTVRLNLSFLNSCHQI